MGFGYNHCPFNNLSIQKNAFMDTGSLVIGLILLAISILPIYLMSLSRRNKKKKMLQSLNNIAGKHNCIISQYDICGDIIIGMDGSGKFVFFYKKAKEGEEEHFVDLAEMKDCKMIHTNKTIKQKEGNQKISERIELIFIPMSTGKSEVKWEFYNVEKNTWVTGELQLVEKWSTLITNKLKRK